MSKVYDALRRARDNQGDSVAGRDRLSEPMRQKPGEAGGDDPLSSVPIGIPIVPNSDQGRIADGADSSSRGGPWPLPEGIEERRLLSSELHPRLIMWTDPETPECEQFRTLRTQIMHEAASRPLQVMAVTSALAGEGKTSTVLNLAASMARSGETRVLVVDGDMRRPNVAAYLGLRPARGLGEALAGDSSPWESLLRLEDSAFYLLPVRREIANPTELLSSSRMVELLATLRRYFDYILIDSPPVLPFADARLLTNLADAAILVIRAGMAPHDVVEKSIAAISPHKILGVVLNGAEDLQEANYYHYYYDSGRRSARETFLQRQWGKWLGRKPHF